MDDSHDSGSMSPELPGSFEEMGLSEQLLAGLNAKGYTEPTEIQARAIPVLLQTRDLVGQAQTGTGKTAAFALPLLQKLRVEGAKPQALVLAPTRELAVQVCEAVAGYAAQRPGIRAVTVYGGAPIFRQLQELRRGVHVVVGTPGRIMDLIQRGALQLGNVETVVLDEADEMLRMGFIEDVEWILSHTPEERQTALFSATMPDEIRRIAHRYLRKPQHIVVESATRTAQKIEERCLVVPHRQKLPALCRVLEAEASDGVLIFARTRANCNELTQQLRERGFSCMALHGDVSQSQREEIVKSLKSGQTKIVVATDVAARGLDVDCITHVINFDVPMDAETYVHRIGRTGRAGRTGVALLVVTPKERRAVRAIERFTGQQMREISVPSNVEIAKERGKQLRERVRAEINAASEDGKSLEPYRELVRELLESDAGEGGPVELAASLMRLAAADKPLVFDQPEWEGMGDAGDRDRNMVRLYISAGRRSGLRPGQLVAAVANAANIPGKAIGAIDIRENASFFDLDGAYVAALMDNVKRVLIQGNRVKISPARPHQGPGGRDGGRGEGAYEDRRSGGFRPRTPKPHRSHAGPRGPRRKPSDSRFRGKR